MPALVVPPSSIPPFEVPLSDVPPLGRATRFSSRRGPLIMCAMSPFSRALAHGAPLVALALLVGSGSAGAQSLRGSKAKVDRAYQFALHRGIEFNASRSDITDRVKDGDYVRLLGGANVRLKGVAVPYVLPATRDFVLRLATSYRKACRAPLVVTSAMRPTALQRTLPNGVAKSVHPTGMAVDLHAPSGSCRPWLRKTLLAEAKQGTVDATEEHNPAHFHVIVFR